VKFRDEYELRVVKQIFCWLTFALGAYIAALILLVPGCPTVPAHWKVETTDVHGKFEYCLSVKRIAGRFASYRIEPDSVCGTDKVALQTLADKLQAQSHAELDACTTRYLQNPNAQLVTRVRSWFE